MKRADTQLRPSRRTPAPGRRTVRLRALAGAGLVLALAGSLAGCSTRSPATIVTPYEASDGINVSLGNRVLLRNVLVVAAEKGGPGAVVARVVNDSNRVATVELAAQLGPQTPFGQTRVTVPPHVSVLVAPGQPNQMVVNDMPVGPGGVIEMSAAASDAGAVYFKAPVLLPEGPYASVTVAPTTPPPTPTGTPSASTTGQPSESVTPTTETPTETPTS